MSFQDHPIRFSAQRAEFFTTLTKRVNQYFTEKQISRHANSEMVIKTIFMLSIYFIPYVLMITGTVDSLWGMTGLCVVMGIAIAGIGLSVMHDANHGAYSNKKW